MAVGAAGDQVTIPAIFINKVEGNMLRDALEGGKNVQVSIVNNLPEGPDQMDSDFDNGIIAHEYGHGISSRLTGGCLYGDEQAGEGWSDFFALMMTNNIDDNGDEPHGIGTYVSAEQNDGRGIRSYPYSRDMGNNLGTRLTVFDFTPSTDCCTQAYDDGEYDTGVINIGDEQGTYAKYTENIRKEWEIEL